MFILRKIIKKIYKSSIYLKKVCIFTLTYYLIHVYPSFLIRVISNMHDPKRD